MPLKVVKGRHGSPHFYLRGTVRGIAVDESTGTGKRAKAEEIRARRESELLEQSIHGRAAVATFAAAAVSYMESGGERRYVTPLIEHFGGSRLSAIDQIAVDLAAKTIKPKGGPATINRQIHTPISAIMKHAAQRRMCDLLPIERPRQPKGKTRWLRLEEVSALVAACAPHLRPLVTFMFYTGARVSEAVYLDWREVDLQRRHVMFLDTKNGEHRGVPLHPAALAELANLPHRVGAVCRKPNGQPYPILDEGGGQIKTAFKGACRRAGIAGATPHTLRHTWATWFYLKHRGSETADGTRRWKSESMVFRYTHVNRSRTPKPSPRCPIWNPGEIRGTGSSQFRKCSS